ncbi:MAG: plastocyanin/azurin family copper-binding protein [Limisphaerales bacterium]
MFHTRCLLLGLLTLIAGLSPITRAAGDDQPKKTLFLPKSPVAAAYVLGRLSNKELIEAPRSEFVYVALLERKGVDKKYRSEALAGLAKTHNTDALTELIGGIGDLDKKGEAAEPVLQDLASLLLQTKPAELAAQRVTLEKLATDAQQPLARQIGWAALITADGAAGKSWQQTASDPARRSDLLLSMPLIRDAALRAALYPRVEPLLHKADPPEVRRAAIAAIAAVPGHDVETFNSLAAMVNSGTELATAVASLQRIPRKAWPKDNAEPLINSLVAYLQQVPVAQRTDPDAINAFQLATDLASLLPPEKAKTANKTLRGIGVSVFVVRTIPEQMLFNKTLIVVEAGKPVEIILINDDAMPHNIAIIMPGALEEVGTMAEKMAPDPDAQGRLYVPDSPKVLHATRLADPGQQVKLSFTAPTEPGDYPYVCTFPGHWRRMVGTLAVVKDVEVYLASHAAEEPKLTEWKLADLAPELAKVGYGRKLEAGKALFTTIGCAQCHKIGAEGNTYGPDLTDVFKRWKEDRASVLQQILEPSTVIADRYRTYEFELNDGDSVLGVILKEDADSLTIQTGPSDKLIQTLKKSDVKSRQPQKSSVMPLGLLNTLTKDQIFDLLAYLESGGNLPTHAHQH